MTIEPDQPPKFSDTLIQQLIDLGVSPNQVATKSEGGFVVTELDREGQGQRYFARNGNQYGIDFTVSETLVLLSWRRSLTQPSFEREKIEDFALLDIAYALALSTGTPIKRDRVDLLKQSYVNIKQKTGSSYTTRVADDNNYRSYIGDTDRRNISTLASVGFEVSVRDLKYEIEIQNKRDNEDPRIKLALPRRIGLNDTIGGLIIRSHIDSIKGLDPAYINTQGRALGHALRPILSLPRA